MIASQTLVGLLLVGTLILSTDAAAKEFRPGDLSVCNASRCVLITSPSVLNAVASFYYDRAQPPARAPAPRRGVPFFRLQYSNGYVSGIVAGVRLEWFLSYGVNLDQFRAGVWYDVPASAAVGLQRLRVGLAPLRLTAAAVTAPDTFSSALPDTTRPSPRGQHPAASAGMGDTLRWALALAVVVASIAVVLLARRRRRSMGDQLASAA